MSACRLLRRRQIIDRLLIALNLISAQEPRRAMQKGAELCPFLACGAAVLAGRIDRRTQAGNRVKAVVLQYDFVFNSVYRVIPSCAFISSTEARRSVA